VKNYDDTLSRFYLIPERYDGQTDRQAGRFAISKLRVSLLTRDKKLKQNSNKTKCGPLQ